MKPIAIFYHCLFVVGEEKKVLESASRIVAEQMDMVRGSGLLDAVSEFVVGINGDDESRHFANLLIPDKARKVYHGLGSRSENMTLVELEKWLPGHPGWNVLYFHAKGSTHGPESDYGNNVVKPWRKSMMEDCVTNWRRCVADMDNEGYESAGSHFMAGLADGTQNIWAGNFWWATSDFLRTLPSIFERDRIKESGIASLESRYEAEVWIGNGPRIPRVKQYRPNGGNGVP